MDPEGAIDGVGWCTDEISDAELLARSARGDRQAFDEIVTRHGPRALRLAARMAPDLASAEDIAQEAMVRVWQRGADFDARRARFTTWLYRIVLNLCIDLDRRPKPVPMPEHLDPADPAPLADEVVEAEQLRSALAGAIDALPTGQRAALVLVYEEGLSGAEAAHALGITAKAVERLLARARAQLRERLLASAKRAQVPT